MIEYDQEYFERITLDLTGNPVTDTFKRIVYHSAPIVRALMIKLFLNPRTVLDVGCGKGSLVLWLRRFGIETHGVDTSDYALGHAYAPVKKYLSRGDIFDLPFENDSFELVTTFDVLEHIREEDLPRTIKECQRVGRGLVLHKIWGTTWLEQRFPVKDPTHTTIKPHCWWQSMFAKLKVKPAAKFLPKWETGIFLLEK